MHVWQAWTAVAAMMIGSACASGDASPGGDTPSPGDGQARGPDGDTASGAPCDGGRALAEGGCCEAPALAALDGVHCVEARPAACPGRSAAEDACALRWCRVGSSCELDGFGCFKGLRACTPTDGAGCAAGEWLVPWADFACLPAGLASDPGPGGGPTWCGPLTHPRPCGPGEHGCEAGTWPEGDGCRPAGPTWSCPSGFVEGTATGLPDCAPDEADCLPWEPLAGAVHVDQSASAPGDGTFEHPFSSLAEGLDAAKAGTTILVAPGDYAGPLTVDKPLTIRGVCAARVRLSGDATSPVVTVSGSAHGSATIEGVRLGGPGRGAAVVATDNLSLLLSRSLIEGVAGPGVAADVVGARVTLRDVVIRGVGEPAGGTDAIGLQVAAGAFGTLERVRLGPLSGAALRAGSLTGSGAHVGAKGLVIGPLARTSSGGRARGLHIEGHATIVDVVGVRLGPVDGVGVDVAQGEVDLSDTVIEGVESSLDGDPGRALTALGANVVLVGSIVRGTRGVALLGDGTRLAAGGLVVEGTRVVPGDPWSGAGVLATSGTLVELVSSWVRTNETVGLVAAEAGCSVLATATRVDAGGGSPTGDGPVEQARGAEIGVGASMELQGVMLTVVGGPAVLVGPTGELAAGGAALAGGAGSAGDAGGASRGVEVRGAGARVTLAGSRLTGFEEAGLRVGPGAEADLTGVVVSGAASPGATGILTAPGGRATVEASALTPGGQAALRAGGETELSDCLIAGGASDADGVVADPGASVTLRRATIREAPRAGLVIRDGATVTADALLCDGGRFGVAVEGSEPWAGEASTVVVDSAEEAIAQPVNLGIPPAPVEDTPALGGD